MCRPTISTRSRVEVAAAVAVRKEIVRQKVVGWLDFEHGQSIVADRLGTAM